MSNVEFRFANSNDCALILKFITLLAIYENMESDVVATEELLKETIFNQKKAEVLFVLKDNVEVGFALFFSSYSTFLGKPGIFLEDLFVLEQHRGFGYGKALLNKLKEVTIERNCGRLEWNCLDWNTPSIKFYESIGAKQQSEWIGFRLDKNNLK